MYNHVTNRQMAYIIFITLTTYNIIGLPYNMARAAGRGGWLPLLVATFIYAVLFVFIAKLNSMFPGKTLFDYTPEIVGKFFSYIICLFYSIYFIFVFIFLHAEIFSLIQRDFLPNTPIWAMSFVGIAVFGYIAYKGITNIARLFELIVPIFIVVSMLFYVLALFQGMKFNTNPLFEPDRLPDYAKALTKTVIPFLGVEVLLLIPFTPQNKKTGKLMFFTISFVGLYYVLVVESSIKIVGINTIMHYETAVIEALRLVELPVIDRVDILYQTVGFCGLFLGISMVYTAALELICKIIPKAKRAIAAAVLGLIFYVLCFVIESMKDMDDIMKNILTIVGIFTAIVLPAMLFIIAKVRKHVEKNN